MSKIRVCQKSWYVIIQVCQKSGYVKLDFRNCLSGPYPAIQQRFLLSRTRTWMQNQSSRHDLTLTPIMVTTCSSLAGGAQTWGNYETIWKNRKSRKPEKRKSKCFPSLFGNFGPNTCFPRSPNRAASFGMARAHVQDDVFFSTFSDLAKLSFLTKEKTQKRFRNSYLLPFS